MASRTTSTDTKRGFYGVFDFLDNQAAFLKTCGTGLGPLPENPKNGNCLSYQRILRGYGKKCKLDIFLHLCRLNYPEELFDKFTQLSVSLPSNSKTWSIQLCSTYLSSLSKELVDNMPRDYTFTMLDLTTLTTKALQLEVLRTVRSEATKSFESLLKQKGSMAKLLRNLQPSHNRGFNMNLNLYNPPNQKVE